MSKYQLLRNISAASTLMCVITLVMVYEFGENDKDLTTVAIITLCSFLLWIVALLIDLNHHFENEENKNDDEIY